MQLRHIQVFNAIMVSGSVSGAARLLNVTQPAVSRSLQHAELQLGFALFHRVRNRLVPSPEAHALYPHVEQLFGHLDAVGRVASNLRAGAAVTELKVLSILALGHEVLPRALTVFRQKYPKVQVTFRATHSPDIIRALALQEADVGLLYGATPHPALVQDTLAELELVCVARKDFFASKAKKSGVSLDMLTKLPVVGLEMNDPLGTMLAHACREAGAGFEASCSVQTYHAALALARHGHGVAIVDACTAMSARADEVDVLPVRPAIPIALHAVRPAARPHSVVARAFIGAVLQVLPRRAAMAPNK